MNILGKEKIALSDNSVANAGFKGEEACDVGFVWRWQSGSAYNPF